MTWSGVTSLAGALSPNSAVIWVPTGNSPETDKDADSPTSIDGLSKEILKTGLGSAEAERRADSVALNTPMRRDCQKGRGSIA